MREKFPVQPHVGISPTSGRDAMENMQLICAVEFRLEERIPNTNQWRVFAKAVYTLKRSFASDFDF